MPRTPQQIAQLADRIIKAGGVATQESFVPKPSVAAFFATAGLLGVRCQKHVHGDVKDPREHAEIGGFIAAFGT